MAVLDEEAAYRLFASQAEKCETLASADPGAYRRRVTWLALVGYAFAPAVLLTLLALFAALIWLYATGGLSGGRVVLGKIGIALVVLIAMVVRAMWPSFGKIDGTRLRRGDAPDLFTFIDAVRKKAGNPRVNGVYVTDELNAAVAQTPRLGLLGWYRNDLILGLPLLQALTKQEFAAVIAHEFGHLSGAHGKLDAWIYRTRLLMARILSAIEEKSYFGSWIFRWFYRWYQPYFAAYSFALARDDEYEADRMAASVTSQQVIIDALVRLSVADYHMGRTFWGEVWDGVDRDAMPPDRVYNRLGKAMTALAAWEGARDSFDAERARTTDYSDTHPSLSDRAGALGVAPRLPIAAEDAAITLLPNAGADLEEGFSKNWRTAVAEAWEERHTALQDQRRRLADLDAAAETALAEGGALTEADAAARGGLAEKFLGPEAGLARFDQALAWSPESDVALFAKGRILLILDRDEGLTFLDRVMEKNEDAIVPACELAEAYLARNQRAAEAEAYQTRREAYEALLNEDWTDRRQVMREDTFLAHQSDAETVNDIVLAIESFKKKGLKKASLVRKVTRHRQWEPAYLLICEIGSVRRWSEDMDALQKELSHALTDNEDLSVAVCDVGDEWLRDKVTEIPGAQIYPRT